MGSIRYSVDPVEGGVENNYVYPPDPVNEQDLTGMAKGGKQSNSPMQYSKDEIRAKYLRDRGVSNYDPKAFKSFEQKERLNQKFERTRNQQKRLNMLKNAGKGVIERGLFIILPVNFLQRYSKPKGGYA